MLPIHVKTALALHRPLGLMIGFCCLTWCRTGKRRKQSWILQFQNLKFRFCFFSDQLSWYDVFWWAAFTVSRSSTIVCIVNIGQHMWTHWQHRCSSRHFRHSGGFACWALASRTPCLGRWDLRLKAAAKSIASLAWSLASHLCTSYKVRLRWSIMTIGPSFIIFGHNGYIYLSTPMSVYTVKIINV